MTSIRQKIARVFFICLLGLFLGQAFGGTKSQQSYPNKAQPLATLARARSNSRPQKEGRASDTNHPSNPLTPTTTTNQANTNLLQTLYNHPRVMVMVIITVLLAWGVFTYHNSQLVSPPPPQENPVSQRLIAYTRIRLREINAKTRFSESNLAHCLFQLIDKGEEKKITQAAIQYREEIFDISDLIESMFNEGTTLDLLKKRIAYLKENGVTIEEIKGKHNYNERWEIMLEKKFILLQRAFTTQDAVAGFTYFIEKGFFNLEDHHCPRESSLLGYFIHDLNGDNIYANKEKVEKTYAIIECLLKKGADAHHKEKGTYQVCLYPIIKKYLAHQHKIPKIYELLDLLLTYGAEINHSETPCCEDDDKSKSHLGCPNPPLTGCSHTNDSEPYREKGRKMIRYLLLLICLTSLYFP
ncbi:MAG: hypothetical protein ACPGC9_02555, partial [Cytophagales bacterium]